MDIETERIFNEVKKVIPTLNIIITYNTGIILVENNLIYSTQGPMTEKFIQCYLYGLYQGIIGALNNTKIIINEPNNDN